MDRKTRLVLERKAGESIDVSGPCSFTVERVKGGRVKVSIVAERAVVIRRGEIQRREAA